MCLQEIKAASDQVPAALCEMEGYWCYWHGGKGYSGVGLHVSRTAAAERPVFAHPEFNFENRIAAVDIGDLTVASVYVPNGGKDFPAKIRFLEALDEYFGGDGLCVVEWPAAVPTDLVSGAVRMTLDATGETHRRIMLHDGPRRLRDVFEQQPSQTVRS